MVDIEIENVTPTGNWDYTSGDIKVPAPTVDTDASTKKYVDDNSGGSPEGTAVLSTGEAGAVKFLREDGDGTCSWQTPAGSGDMTKAIYDTDSNDIVDKSEAVHDFVRKGSVGTITKCSPVYISGWNAGGWIEVEEADADNASTMPGIGIAAESITNSADAEVIFSGTLEGCDTSSFSVGDELWIGTTAGTLTNTKPTGTAEIQKIAQVLRSHASLGVLEVFGAGRSNDLPNIANTKIWIGDASGVPQEFALSGDATMSAGGVVTIDHVNINNIGEPYNYGLTSVTKNPSIARELHTIVSAWFYDELL